MCLPGADTPGPPLRETSYDGLQSVPRNLRLLTETEFDVLVVGAGIYGAAIAWDAAQRGLAVARIDRGDFGAGTSLNSLKTVHGGLRSLVGKELGRTLVRSRTDTTPLAGGDIPDIARFLDDARRASRAIEAPTLERLARSYGTAYPRLLSMIEAEPMLARPLGATCAVTRAEILYGVREEMVVRLPDALLRRTEAGSAAHPGRDALEASAAIMAAESGWDRSRVATEMDAVEARFRLT